MKRLWLGFGIVLIVSFAILGWIGTRIYQEMPPIPERIVSADGAVVAEGGEHLEGSEAVAGFGDLTGVLRDFAQ